MSFPVMITILISLEVHRRFQGQSYSNNLIFEYEKHKSRFYDFILILLVFKDHKVSHEE